MKNCSVTRFDVDTQNDNLDYFDALEFTITTFSGEYLRLKAGSYVWGGVGCTYKVLSNGYLSDGYENIGTEHTLSNNESLFLYPIDSSKPTVFLIMGLDNYVMTTIDSTNGIKVKNPANLAYLHEDALLNSSKTILHYFCAKDDSAVDWKYATDNISAAAKQTITTLRIQNLNLTNNEFYSKTSYWAGFTALTQLNYYSGISEGDVVSLKDDVELTVLQLRKSGITGDIADLGYLYKLNSLNAIGASLHGSIEDWVAALCDPNKGNKTSGTISGVRFNSSSQIKMYNADTTYITAAPKTLTWTDATHFTFE